MARSRECNTDVTIIVSVNVVMSLLKGDFKCSLLKIIESKSKCVSIAHD